MYLFFLGAMCVLVGIILVHKFWSYLIVDTILADWLTIPNLTYVQIQAKAYPQRSIHRGEVEENILSFKWKWNWDEMFSAQNVVNDVYFRSRFSHFKRSKLTVLYLANFVLRVPGIMSCSFLISTMELQQFSHSFYFKLFSFIVTSICLLSFGEEGLRKRRLHWPQFCRRLSVCLAIHDR